MRGALIALFAMDQASHVRRLCPLVAGLARRGARCLVYTHPRYAAEVKRAGGTLVDMLGRRPLEEADASSRPAPLRFVAYAARHAEEIARELRAEGARAVVYDTPAVVGRVAALKLGVPYVNLCAGHALDPAVFVPWLEKNPRVQISEACHSAVETLRARDGLADASPYSFVTGLSPHLNVYCEPEAFLSPAERRAFEPIAFHGSLAALEELPRVPGDDGAEEGPRVYLSLGTVAWKYHEERVLASLAACVEALATLPSASAVLSLGGADLPEEKLRRLRAPNVRVERYVDQWAALARSDAFVTHHGLNSTHEAIYMGVPMISVPLSWDQPGLARRCRELGLAIPLVEESAGPPRPADMLAALETLARDRAPMRERLRAAAAWERETIARRGEVLDRIEGICS